MAYVEAAERRRQMIAAAREALANDGVGRTTLRSVAAQAGVPLGTLQYVFPTKEPLLRAVIEDIVEDIVKLLGDAASLDGGVATSLRQGMRNYWRLLVEDQQGIHLTQYELVSHALRTPGLESLAQWQYERYTSVVTDWAREAGRRSGERVTVPWSQLGRLVVAGVDGLIIQYLCESDARRAKRDVDALAEMVVSFAGITRD